MAAESGHVRTAEINSRFADNRRSSLSRISDLGQQNS